jgi:DNA-binding transcriptional MerR regulator
LASAGASAGAATTAEFALVRVTALQAVRLTGATRAQLDAWVRAGLVSPGPDYEFGDLVAVRLVAALLDAGLSPTRIRIAMRHIAQTDEAVDEARLVTDGDTVRQCQTDAEVLDALGRSAAETRAAIAAFDAERQGFVETLRAG